jgi:hypothetical protein
MDVGSLGSRMSHCTVYDFAFRVDPFVLECQVNQKQQPRQCSNGYLGQHSLRQLHLRLLLSLARLDPDPDYSFFSLTSSFGVVDSHCNAECTVLPTKWPIECSDVNII